MCKKVVRGPPFWKYECGVGVDPQDVHIWKAISMFNKFKHDCKHDCKHVLIRTTCRSIKDTSEL